MKKLNLPLTLLCLAACGGSIQYTDHYEVGEVQVVMENLAEPWDDFPDVLWHLQYDADHKANIPGRLWKDLDIYIRPVGRPHPEMESFGMSAACFYQWSSKDIFIRPSHDNTHMGCFAHEMAHRWVDLYGLDDDCTEEDVHQCAGWIDRNAFMRAQVCPHSWAWPEDKAKCPTYVPPEERVAAGD